MKPYPEVIARDTGVLTLVPSVKLSNLPLSSRDGFWTTSLKLRAWDILNARPRTPFRSS